MASYLNGKRISGIRDFPAYTWDEYHALPVAQRPKVWKCTDRDYTEIPRESVSVTADGVKTYSQLLDSLFALIDFSKITENSVVKISSSTVMQVYTMSVMHPNTDMHLFRLARSGSQCVETVTVLLPSGSTMGYWTGGTYTNESGNAPASGRVIALCY